MIGSILAAIAGLLFTVLLIVVLYWAIKAVLQRSQQSSVACQVPPGSPAANVKAWIDTQRAGFEDWIQGFAAKLKPVHDAARKAIDNALNSLDSTRATILELMESAAANPEVQAKLKDALALVERAMVAVVVGAITATVASPNPESPPQPVQPPAPPAPLPPAPAPAPAPAPKVPA